MNKKIGLYALFFLLAFAATAQTENRRSISYLNQEPPGLSPEVFAPDIVSLENQHEFGSVFSHDGKEFFYAVDRGGNAEIRYIELKNGRWSLPRTLLSAEKYSFNDPFYSPDERRLYFISDIAFDGTGEKKDYDIWFIEKTGDNWSMPRNAGIAINSRRNEYYMSFTGSWTMYFSSNVNADKGNINNYDIYTSQFEKGEFQSRERIVGPINTEYYEADVFVAYDESYMIFCSVRPGGYGKGDLYISFKGADDTWTTPENLSENINTAEHELCPFVTKDGKYLFYTSNKDIYWVDAEILRRPK